MLDETLSVPLYKQLNQLLQKKIINGDWPYKHKIPSESELCEQYHISRMTVRLALDELKNQGYVYRKQGRGTFVTRPKIERRLSSVYRFSDDIEKMGYKIQTEILYFDVEKAAPEVVAKMELEPRDLVFRIQRLHRCNETPFAVETSYIPQNLCPRLTEDAVAEAGLYHSLNTFGIRPDNATEVLESILVEEKYRTLLGTEKIAPGFYIQRTSFQKGQPVEFCEGCVRGDLIRYSTVLTEL